MAKVKHTQSLRRTGGSQATGSSNEVSLAAYLRDAARCPLMSPEEERQHGEVLAELRKTYWCRLMAYPPYVEAIIAFVRKETTQPESEGDAVFEDRCGQLSHATAAVRKRDRKATQDAFTVAVRDFAGVIVQRDQGCQLADRIAVDLEQLGLGQPAALLSVRPPRRGSRPYEQYLASMRSSATELRVARNEFARANLRLVVRFAGRLRGSGLSLTDLVQEGNIGLLKAVDRFESVRGFRFSTYAGWWIRHHMQRAVADRGRTIRLPQHLHTLALKINKMRRQLQDKLGRDPLDTELAEAAGTTVDKVEVITQALAIQPISLDTRVFSDDPRSVGDLLSAPEEHTPGERLDTLRAEEQMRTVLLSLPPMERDILRQRFGLDGQEPCTLAEIGKRYSLSRERIRQLQERALEHMKQRMEARGCVSSGTFASV